MPLPVNHGDTLKPQDLDQDKPCQFDMLDVDPIGLRLLSLSVMARRLLHRLSRRLSRRLSHLLHLDFAFAGLSTSETVLSVIAMPKDHHSGHQIGNSDQASWSLRIMEH